MCRPFCVRGAHGNGISGVVTAAFGDVGMSVVRFFFTSTQVLKGRNVFPMPRFVCLQKQKCSHAFGDSICDLKI